MSVAWNVDLPTTQYVAHDLPTLALGSGSTQPRVDPRCFIRVGSMEHQNLVNEIKANRHVAIDTETTGLVKWRDVPLYWSLAWGERRCTLHIGALASFLEAFADPNKEWVMANAKYDTHMLANVGVHIAGRLVDTQVMHTLLYEDRPHDLKSMAKHILEWEWADFKDTFGKITKKNTPEDIIRTAEAQNMPLLVEYAANDAFGTLKLYWALKKELQSARTYSLFRTVRPYIDTLWDYFDKVEKPYTKVLWKMERKGARVDVERMEGIRPTAEEEIARVEKDIVKHVGHAFSPTSNDDKAKYFYETKKYVPFKHTKGGKSGNRKPSVDAHVLGVFAEQYGDPVAELCIKHAELSKLLGTYIIGLRSHCDPDGRIHCSFNQDIVRTGRLSSRDPNLQNIPKPENDKWNLRGSFIPDPGKAFVSADYEQLEMRLLAAAAMEKDMIAIFERNWDIHMGNASLMFGIPYDDIKTAKKIEGEAKAGKRPMTDVTDYVRRCLDARAAAKNIGFGLNYGMGATKLARSLKVSRKEAEEKIAIYKKTYPAVTLFFEEAVRETRETGYAFTILGRRRNVPEIASYRNDERALGERLAINTQIQGSAADATKMAQIIIDSLNLDKYYGYEQILQIHDEINGECPIDVVEQVKREVKDAMEHPFAHDLAVYLAVDINHGPNWAAAK